MASQYCCTALSNCASWNGGSVGAAGSTGAGAASALGWALFACEDEASVSNSSSS